MPITRTPMIDDDGSGTTGTIINNAWKQEFYNQIDATVGGVWQAVPFNAANFYGSSPMVWTVGSAAVLHNRCALSGKTLFWSMYLSWFSGSNVLSGSPSQSINLTIPLGLSIQTNQVQIIAQVAGVAGVAPVGGLLASGGGSFVYIQKGPGGNFALTDIPGFITTFILEAV
jgi:hypothetical protein